VAVVRIIVCVLFACSVAHADDRPWAAGVSDDDQRRATELFVTGNQHLDQGQYAPAVDPYRKALAIWDHPAIRYNLAVALINLERPIEAYRELERALRFGAAPFDPDVYPQALVYERQLRARIVELRIECADPGTRITLDDNVLSIACPGAAVELALPGAHRIVATKPGHLPRAIEMPSKGGDTIREQIDLKTEAEATIERRRWPTSRPWLVIGAGAAVAAVGLGFELQSAATFRSYDKAVAVLCPDGPCATLPPIVDDAYDDGRRQNRIAIGLFVTGGAAIATGAVLLWLNRPIAERIGYDGRVIATVGSGGGAIGFGGRF
jgi:hypothetical protein